MFGGLITCTNSQVTIGGVPYPIGPTICGLTPFGVLGVLGATLDLGYGTALGKLGQIFRGRPPGQSFAACVDQNINQATLGLARNSTKVLATGLGGTALTAVGSTSSGFSLAEDLLIRAASIVPRVNLPSALTAVEFGGQAVAVGGGAALGLFIGSAANCASQGVSP